MTNILLLGAGFTYNWGGWLAREVRSKIAVRLETHPYLRDLLNKHNSFENALEEVQSEYLSSRNPRWLPNASRHFRALLPPHSTP